MAVMIFEFPAPRPKSQIRFQLRVIDGEIQNQLQIVTASGNVKVGNEKDWRSLPTKKALKDPLPNGPDA